MLISLLGCAVSHHVNHSWRAARVARYLCCGQVDDPNRAAPEESRGGPINCSDARLGRSGSGSDPVRWVRGGSAAVSTTASISQHNQRCDLQFHNRINTANFGKRAGGRFGFSMRTNMPWPVWSLVNRVPSMVADTVQPSTVIDLIVEVDDVRWRSDRRCAPAQFALLVVVTSLRPPWLIGECMNFASS